MGGCCCCSSRSAHLNRTPVYYYCPQALEEHEPLSSQHGAASTLTGLLVDTNLETSIPDTYRAPPAPIPYNVDFGRPQTSPTLQGTGGDKNESTLQTEDTEFVGDTISGSSYETSAACEDLKETDCKSKTDIVINSPKKLEDEHSKPTEPIVSATEEDVCPTCFEEYDAENPKIITQCEHHFHLSCILEWMERSDTCPVCNQEMIFNHTLNV